MGLSFPLVTWGWGTGTAWSFPAVTSHIPVSLTLPQAGPLPSLCLYFPVLFISPFQEDTCLRQKTPESQCPQPDGPQQLNWHSVICSGTKSEPCFPGWQQGEQEGGLGEARPARSGLNLHEPPHLPPTPPGLSFSHLEGGRANVHTVGRVSAGRCPFSPKACLRQAVVLSGWAVPLAMSLLSPLHCSEAKS